MGFSRALFVASVFALLGCPAPEAPAEDTGSASESGGSASGSSASASSTGGASGGGSADARTTDGGAEGETSADSSGGPGGSNDSNTLLAIGDSVLEWNAERGASIPDVIADLTGLAVTNASVSGAMVLEDERGIPAQYEPSDWEWVVIDGGANDVGDGCGCGDCVGVVDSIVTDDAGAGVMVELLDRVEADGAGIVLLGYYALPPGGEFDDCDEEFVVLHERYALLASQREAVIYVDMGEAIDPLSDPETLDEDEIHPSVEGSAAIGALIAERIQP